jgi:hypothetical protein
MFNVKKGLRISRYFAKVSESRYSPLVLVEAPTQWCHTHLVCTRAKCFLWASSSSLQHGEPLTTMYKLKLDHPQALWMIVVLLIAIEPSRWRQSSRVTTTNFSLNLIKSNKNNGHALATLNVLMRLVIKWLSTIKSLTKQSLLLTLK